MSAPPPHKEIDTDSKSYAAASAPNQSQQEQANESLHSGDKDRKHGKEEAKDTHAEPPAAAAETPPVSHDVKVPEPGFDAPEDKMQGGRAAFLPIQMPLRLHGNCPVLLWQRCLHSVPLCMLLCMP